MLASGLSVVSEVSSLALVVVVSELLPSSTQLTPEPRFMLPVTPLAPELTPELTPELKPELTPELTPELAPELTPELPGTPLISEPRFMLPAMPLTPEPCFMFSGMTPPDTVDQKALTAFSA